MSDFNFTGKPYDVGFICGRFQTFHKGHESLIDTGLRLCDRILIMVGSAQEYGTERNPFNVSTRIKMLESIYGKSNPDIKIVALSDMSHENNDCPEWGKYLLKNIDRYIYKVPDLMIYGNDDRRSKWFDKDDIKDVTEVIVNRGRIPITATQVREYMVFDDRHEWQKWVNPKLHKMYDELRSELMSIPFYQELYKKLSKGESK